MKNKNMRNSITDFIGAVTFLCLLLLVNSYAGETNTIYEPVLQVSNFNSPVITSGNSERANYNGIVRVFLVEPTSRWQDANGVNFNFGFLDFPLITGVSIADKETWGETVTWDAAAAGYGDITINNIMAIVVVSDAEAHPSDAYPPYGFYYDAYYVDATVSATPGVPGQIAVTPGFTHTVFIEEGTSTE
ncbi:MAG: hypothetical protein ACE5D6_00630 [Candidatus Zixiibacteriota bacterium]